MGAPDVKQLVDGVANELDADLIAYFGDVTAYESRYLVTQCHKRRRRKNVLLLLATYGGDPNAAYRIGRTLQECYKTKPPETDPKEAAVGNHEGGEFWICIDNVCKSAGTIICLGADLLFMSEHAELGPIDIQLRKQDEVGERTSGLTPIQAVNFLETQSAMLFKRHFRELRESGELGFSSKMAAELATKLSVGLLTPIYQQIDPIRLAEVDRSLRISKEYGERLKSSNIKEGSIDKLIARYPSHGFVIDRKEARELFERVEDVSSTLKKILGVLKQLADWTLEKDDEAFVHYLSTEPPQPAPPPAPEQQNDEPDR